MALGLRRRGEIWHARGTVRVGRETIRVAEFSTGARSRADAEAAIGAEEARIRADHLDGGSGRARRLTIADCLDAYLDRPGGVRPHDQARVAALNDAMGARPLVEAPDAWRAWRAAHSGHQPGTAARIRTILAAALAEGARVHRATAPALPPVRQDAPDRIVYLTEPERRRLLASYTPWAACPVLLLAYQGLRTQEALRLDWRRVDLHRETLHIVAEETKTRRGRTVPMHPRVRMLLWGMWHAAGKPDAGPVFLSQRGAPYADTRGRGDRQQGGNPLAKAHATACRRAGIRGFRVHDWRHEFAARAVMGGMDLYTLRVLGGWSSLRMVERYASVTAGHLAEAIRRIG